MSSPRVPAVCSVQPCQVLREPGCLDRVPAALDACSRPHSVSTADASIRAIPTGTFSASACRRHQIVARCLMPRCLNGWSRNLRVGRGPTQLLHPSQTVPSAVPLAPRSGTTWPTRYPMPSATALWDADEPADLMRAVSENSPSGPDGPPECELPTTTWATPGPRASTQFGSTETSLRRSLRATTPPDLDF